MKLAKNSDVTFVKMSTKPVEKPQSAPSEQKSQSSVSKPVETKTPSEQVAKFSFGGEKAAVQETQEKPKFQFGAQ